MNKNIELSLLDDGKKKYLVEFNWKTNRCKWYRISKKVYQILAEQLEEHLPTSS